MKLSTLIVLLGLCFSAWAEKVEVSILGMSCEACVSKITRALNATEKCDKINVNIEANRATFETKGKELITDKEIKDAVRSVGYEALKVTRTK